MDRTLLHRSSAVTKLGVYALVLGGALGGGALVGATLGPSAGASTQTEGSDRADEHDDESAAAAPPADALPAGLAVARDGYVLTLATPTVAAGTTTELELVIEGPDGTALTEYTVEHEQELHLVVVSRDLVDYAHVHPTRDDAGTWRVDVPPLAPGSYRVFADFTPADGDGVTLGADLAVPGDYMPNETPDVAGTATVDGYDVTFDGELIAGTESEVTVTVSRDGEPVDDLHPYLGALGHLVAIRDGDLAYLHVHPLEDADGPGGPAVRFAIEVPTAATYRLFFDFSHGDEVRTAAVTAAAAPGDATASADDETSDDAPSDDAPSDEQGHGG